MPLTLGDKTCKKDFIDGWFVIQDDNLKYYYYTKYIKDLYALFNTAINRAYLLIELVTKYFVKKYETMLQLGQEDEVIAELLGGLTIEEYNQMIEQIEEGLADSISTLDDPLAIPEILENTQKLVSHFFDKCDKSQGFDVYLEIAPAAFKKAKKYKKEFEECKAKAFEKLSELEEARSKPEEKYITSDSMLICKLGGVISIVDCGQRECDTSHEESTFITEEDRDTLEAGDFALLQALDVMYRMHEQDAQYYILEKMNAIRSKYNLPLEELGEAPETKYFVRMTYSSQEELDRVFSIEKKIGFMITVISFIVNPPKSLKDLLLAGAAASVTVIEYMHSNAGSIGSTLLALNSIRELKLPSGVFDAFTLLSNFSLLPERRYADYEVLGVVRISIQKDQPKTSGYPAINPIYFLFGDEIIGIDANPLGLP